MNILIIAPHPDDEILGCGGSILKHTDAGADVTVAYLTSGASGDAGIPAAELARRRETEAVAGARQLGASDTVFLKFPDGGVGTGPDETNRLAELIRDKRPGIIYLPHRRDGHRDHAAANRLTQEAVYRAEAHAYQDIKGDPWRTGTLLVYEVWTPMQQYAYVEDITGVMDRKLKAMAAHTSQLANVAYDEAIRGLNRYRGATTGRGDYCEVFGVIRLSSLPA